MYFLVALIVSVISLFLPAIIGSLIHRENLGARLGIATVLTIIYTLLLWWVYWANSIGFYGPAPFFWGVIIGSIIGLLIAGIPSEYDDFHFKGIIPGVVLCAGYILYVLIGVLWIGSSNMFHATEKAGLIGEVKTVSNLSELIKPADNKHICLVSEAMAKTSAQSALSQFVITDGAVAGSRYKIGNPTKQFVDGSIWWIFPLEFSGWQKWKQDPQVPGYLRVSAENPFEQPQAVQTDKQGNEIHIKYLNSASFQYKAERYLRENGYMNYILEDWTFEPDDNWRPFYTVSFTDRTLGFSGKVTKGVIEFDLQTGDITKSSVEDASAWIERIAPLDIIDYNAKKWGEFFQEGWWYNVWHDDKAQQPTPGWYLTYNGQSAQWFTGFTSMSSSDNALTGVMLCDSRTGESTFFKVSGVCESIACDTAKSLWSNFAEYSPVELVPYNIYGVLTYVIPMESKGQFVGVSLISLNNINIKAKGTTLEEALASYREALNSSDANGLVPTDQKPKSIELTGVIERIGLSTKSTQISFKLVGVGKSFQVNYSDTNPEPSFMKEGDTVVITYQETTEIVVTVSTFDIPSVVFEQGSVIQGQYIDQQEKTNEEVDRVEDQQDVQNIINSDEFKDVDPDALQEFLNEQQKTN